MLASDSSFISEILQACIAPDWFSSEKKSPCK